MLKKFQGAMLGVLLGDCLGAPFEGSCSQNMQKIFAVLNTMLPAATECPSSFPYTDDFALTKALAQALVARKEFDVAAVAKSFVQTYKNEPKRGYGRNIGHVFDRLHDEQFVDIYGPAAAQFDGMGSHGNGSAMRISPAALFCCQKDTVQLEAMVRYVTRVTHTHADAVTGAQVQAAAVRAALLAGPDTAPNTLLNTLIQTAYRAEAAETDTPVTRRAKRDLEKHPMPFTHKLRRLRDYRHVNYDVSLHDVDHFFGTDIAALGSVPTAVLCFLRGMTSCSTEFSPESDMDKELVATSVGRSIIYAISLGGDTDTIASMAAAISGGWHGVDALPMSWCRRCEGFSDALDFATALHDTAWQSYSE